MSNALEAGLPLRDLHVATYNPRRVIVRDATWGEWVGGIRAMGGIHTPLLVRQIEGGKTPFEIIAGQRRFQGALEAFEDLDFKVPVRIVDVDDEEAIRISTSENIDRKAMSPGEEAEAAARVLAQCNGNREEAAKRMGWSMANLNNRLKLMACSESVRTALALDELTLGLAELLAGMPHDKQDAMLAQFKKDGMPTIEAARVLILAAAKSLTAAIFNKGECGTCAHNSARQRSMFDNIEEGHCLNAECYDKKTEGQLQSIADGLKDDYQVIRIVRPEDKYAIKKLKAEEVGDAQATACRSCGNFGAAVSGLPNRLGATITSVCFDSQCHGGKVAAKVKADKEAKDAQVAEQAAQAAPAKASTEKGSGSTASQAAQPKPSDAAKDAPKPKAEAPTVTLTNAVHEFRDKLYKRVIFKVYAVNPEQNARFTLAMLMAGKGRDIDSNKLSDTVAKTMGQGDKDSLGSRHNPAKALKSIATMEMDVAKNILHNVAVMALEAIPRGELKELVILSGANLADHFLLSDKPGKEFLKTLTKNEIVAIAQEIGIDKAIGDGFKAIANGKKDELIDKVTGVKDFDYQGKVPKVLNPRFEK